MAGLTDLIYNAAKEYVKSDIKMKAIDKDIFKEHINMLSQELVTFVSSVRNLDNKDKTKLTERINQAYKENKKLDNIKNYITFRNKLKNKAAAEETKYAFSTLQTAATVFINILNTLDDNLDDFFQSKLITIYNTKLSHVAIFGIIKEAEVINAFSMFLLNGVTSDLTQETPVPPKYRKEYIQKYLQTTAAIVTKIYDKNKNYSFLNSIDNLKRTNSDFTIIGEDSVNNVEYANVNKLNANTVNLIKQGLAFFNVFRWFGELWNNFQHARYLRKKQEKEWIESQVALLKMELNNEQDTARKEQLKKIIEAYDEQIAKLDRQINEYLESK